MLRDIQRVVRERGQVSLAELAVLFDADAEALAGMVGGLERKGRLRVIERACPACGSGCPGFCPYGQRWEPSPSADARVVVWLDE